MARLSFSVCLASALCAGALTGTACPQNQNAPQTPSAIKAEHLRFLDELNAKDAHGRVPPLDDPRIPGLFKKGWSLAGLWAAAFFEVHPTPSKTELEHLFDDFAPEPAVRSPGGRYIEPLEYSFSGDATQIAPATFVVHASYGVNFHSGTFMVVARNRAGHFKSLWNIKDVAEKYFPQGDEISRWLHLVRTAYYNGPLDVASIVRLSPTEGGHPRFLVDAYQGAHGGTIMAQLSIWVWDGAEAKPLLVKLYYFTVYQDPLPLTGDTLRISTKENLKSLFSCGGCEEPRGVWTIRITPTSVRDLGHRFLQPEYKWADELLWRIATARGTTDLAGAHAAAVLQATMRDLRSDQSENGSFSWGMLDSLTVLRRGKRGAFVLSTDNVRLRFDYALEKGQPYFTNIVRE